MAEFLRELWDWTKIVLFIGGVFVALAGVMWYRAGRLADFFDIKIRHDIGFWVMMGGVAAAGIGFALFYFGL